MEKYLVRDAIECDYLITTNIQDAKKELNGIIKDHLVDGVIYEDLENCGIYKLVSQVEVNIIANRNDYTDEEWKEKGYNMDWTHECEVNIVDV